MTAIIQPLEGQILTGPLFSEPTREGEAPRARAIGFLLSLYQRRLASSTHAMRRSLENRARRLEEGLKRAQDVARLAPPDLDVSEKNPGYDVTSLDLASGELRLIEVKGLGASAGTILLTPNERRVAEDRRDCYWLYVVTDCDNAPRLQEPIRDPTRLDWHEVTKVAHYYLSLDAMTRPMRVREEPGRYGGDSV